MSTTGRRMTNEGRKVAINEIRELKSLVRSCRSMDELDAMLNVRMNELSNMAISERSGPESPDARVLHEVMEELISARKLHPVDMTSVHHGWAVIWEELDELWDEVRKRSVNRDKQAMKREAIQVAATAVRFVVDLLQGGRVN